MNRRRFLRPPPAPPAAPDPPPGEFPLVRVSRRAMATTFEVALPAGTRWAVEAAEAALELVDELETRLTVYRDGGEVAELNRLAASGPVPVDADLFDLLARAVRLSADTGGAFDPAAGALVALWNRAKRDGRVPTGDELRTARAASGVRHLMLDADARAVRFRAPGLQLNLGGVGKGYALDRAAALLRDGWGVRSALLQAGGSSVLAIGAPPTDPRGWLVSVTHPAGDGRTLGTLRLADRALGTSAATFQFFEHAGKRYGHLLDPRTGLPAAGTASASVVAPSAADADALSTAAFVLGEAGARAFCAARPDWAALVLPDGPDAAPVPVNIPPGRWQPPPGPVQCFATPH